MFIDRMNMEILSLQVNENLRFYLLNEMYDKGNYSNADAYYYLNTVSQHVSSFYKALSGFLNNLLQIIGYSIFLIYSDAKTNAVALSNCCVVKSLSVYLIKT